MTRLALLILALALPACHREEAVPSSEQDGRLDATENLLDDASNELDAVASPPTDRS